MTTSIRVPCLLITLALAITACTHRAARVEPEPSDVAGAAQTAETCAPPLRRCVLCNGTAACLTRCPECAPQEAPADEPATVADLTPVGEACGGVICSPGLHCCNPTCGTCTPRGVECTQSTCD